MTLDQREKNYQTKPISHNPQGINGLWLVSSAAGRQLDKTPTDAPPGSKGTVARGQSARGATGQQRTIGAEELLSKQNYQTKPIPSNYHRNNNLHDSLEGQTAERNHLANSKRLSLSTASTAPFRANREQIRTANARGSVKKPGTFPSAVHGRGVLSMTHRRRGDCTQGVFTDPRVSGHTALVVTDTWPVTGVPGSVRCSRTALRCTNRRSLRHGRCAYLACLSCLSRPPPIRVDVYRHGWALLLDDIVHRGIDVAGVPKVPRAAVAGPSCPTGGSPFTRPLRMLCQLDLRCFRLEKTPMARAFSSRTSLRLIRLILCSRSR